MKAFRIVLAAFLLLTAMAGRAQIRQRVPAPDPRGDFGSKFFEDLRSLFGRLQQAELDRAFERAAAVRCSELVSQKGEWKPVAFLNDDRRLGNWHYDSIEEVKSDLISYVFSGVCRGEDGPVKVVTSYPVTESLRKYQDGRIRFAEIVIKDNDPVTATFDRRTNTYTFLLPYLYSDKKESLGNLYSLTPPLTTSKPDGSVSLEFRCKSLSGAELTYRFMLCRNRVVDRDPRAPVRRATQSLGNAAYYILSDGKEANSTVKLTFEDGVELPPTSAPPEAPPAPALESWQPANPEARLVDIAGSEFRLGFNPQTWNGRIERPQLLSAGTLADFTATSMPDRTREYCLWQPAPGKSVGDDSRIYSFTFRKDLQSVTSAIVGVENSAGDSVGNLECYFPHSQTPAEITVSGWTAIVGRHIVLEVRSR